MQEYRKTAVDMLFGTAELCPCKCVQKKVEKTVLETGLEIISGESPDTMTGPIHFSSVTYRFWPVKLYKINNS